MRLATVLGLGLGLAGAAAGQTAPAGFSALYVLPKGFPASTNFGLLMRGGGDVDGDGYGDLLISDASALNAAGEVWVISGFDGGLIYSLTGGAPGDGYGFSLAFARDVDGDGVEDFLVGSTQVGPFPQYGYAEVRSGADASILFLVPGATVTENMGWAVSGVGDVDADGRADFLVAAGGFDAPGVNNAGRIRLYSGVDSAILYEWVGVDAGAGADLVLDGGEDVSGDGLGDFILATHTGGFNDEGRVEVHRCPDGQLLHTVLGTSPLESLGDEVALMGDLDGDGRSEFAYSAPGAGPGGGQSTVDQGLIEVRSGADGAVFQQIWGSNATAQTGVFPVFGNVGDIDQDGASDLMYSEHVQIAPFGIEQVLIRSGASGSLIAMFQNDPGVIGIGGAGCGKSDLTGDGVPDIALTVSFYPSPAKVFTYLRDSLSVSGSAVPGGTLVFSLHCPTAAGWPFLLPLSFGTSGVPFGARTIPLTLDPLFSLSFGFPGLTGTLDAAGEGTLPFSLPPLPGLSGLSFSAASLALKVGAPQLVQAISNPVTVAIQ